MKHNFSYKLNFAIELLESLDDIFIYIANVYVDICFHLNFSKFSFENGRLSGNDTLSIIRFFFLMLQIPPNKHIKFR